MDAVTRTAKDALHAKASAFLSAGYKLGGSTTTQDAGFPAKYIELLEAMAQYVLNHQTIRQASPLVNAGYALRVGTMQERVERFLRFHRPSDNPKILETPSRIRILVLGAGFDAMGLAALAFVEKNVHVIEVDLPGICQVKFAALREEQVKALLPMETACREESRWREIQYQQNQSTYSLVSADLQDLDSLQAVLGGVALPEQDCPTLIVSELVLAYLPPSPRSALLQWLCERFLEPSNQSVMVLYEVGAPSGDSNVTSGYQHTYLSHFQAKLERGVTASNAQTASLFPLDMSSLEAAVRPLAVHRVTAAQAAAASLSAWKSPQLFDEHAALRLYLRSYFLCCISKKNPQSLSTRVVASSAQGSSATNPAWCPLQKKSSVVGAVWITAIYPEDESPVRELFSGCYRHLFDEYPSVRKMVKTALKKDLATAATAAVVAGAEESTIARHYRDQKGVFLVAVTPACGGAQDGVRVVGGVGLRKCAKGEHGIRGRHAHTYEIHRLFVDPELRSYGVAQHLLRRALVIVRQRPVYLVATTLVLLDQATKFYQQQGFAIAEETNVAGLRLRTYGKLLTVSDKQTAGSSETNASN